MARLFVISFLIAAALVSLPARADGNHLLEACGDAVRGMDGERRVNDLNFGYCIGLVQGVKDMIYAFQGNGSLKVACLPKGGMENQQAARIVVQYLRSHPEVLHLELESVLVVQALGTAFPCEPTS